MPRELITVQIGQCGNQIGCKFWEMALKEHAAANPKGVYDEAMSSFFRNVDTRYDDPQEIGVGDGQGLIRSLKARAVVVDMEEGVVNATLKGRLGELFDSRQFLADTSGSGNNWAHGHEWYGPKYREELLEKIRRPAEFCDSLQSFFLMHSMGGGTGSGLGTYVAEMLADEFPDVYRFASVVFPSVDDDVVTSPYNSVLAIEKLNEHVDCVLPVDNSALQDMVAKSDGTASRARGSSGSGPGGAARMSSPAAAAGGGGGGGSSSSTGPGTFDAMNSVVARMLLSLTASMRFEGSLNTDLNEITMNLLPFPRLNFLLTSLSPCVGFGDSAGPKGHGSSSGSVAAAAAASARRIDHSFMESFQLDHQLLRVDPRRNTYLACALLARGDVAISDVNRAIGRVKPDLRMIPWNPDGFKIGLCSVPPVGAPHSVLGLANNTAIAATFQDLRLRFTKIYRRRAHVHHYTDFMEEAAFDASLDALDSLTDSYMAFERGAGAGVGVSRDADAGGGGGEPSRSELASPYCTVPATAVS
jgi:tubulin epsilon